MSVHYLSYNIYNIIFIVLVVLPLAISAQFTNVDSCINITSGSYILVSNFIASRSPCVIIQGSGVELHGNSFTITDNTGSLVGVHVEGSGHYIHDLNVENFAIGLDLYTSNTTIHNVGIDAYTSGNTIGIRASTCTDLEILGSSDPFNLTSTSGSVVGLQINNCVGVHVTNLGLNAQGGVSTTGIQIINSANGFFDSYSLEQHCNPTGVQVTSSRNIRLYAGTTRIYGCATDTTDVVGILVDGSSDILVSKANSLALSGPNKNFAIWGKSSKYIGLYQSNLEVRLSTVPVEVKVILLQNTIGFSVEHSSLIGFASVNESVGIYLMSNSQLGLHLSQVQTVVTGVFVDTTSTFYANSLESTATTVYNFENDAGLCTNQALNLDPQNSCYPPSNDSCCDSFCHRDGASCLQPTISTVLGVPFTSSGAFITILGSNFGDNYYDTVVAFNDSLCLIHDRSDSFIVCWITGDSFSTSSTTEMSLTNGWNTYTSPSLATVICEANSDCPSNICYNGACVAETNNTIIAGEALVLVITLGKNNTLVITIPANTFPAGYNVLSLSKAISPISLASGYSKIADFEFRVLDLNRQIVNAFASGVSFSFTGSDIRSSLNLFASAPQLLEANSWNSGSLSFVVTQASSTGVYALVTPSPSILNITRAPTSGGRVVISGANFGTSKNNLVAIVSGSAQSMYCPLHVSSALVSESSLECDLPAGVGQQLQFSVQFNYPSGIVSALSSYAYLAPSISAVRPDRRISSSELPGLVITVVGTNFGASNAQQHSTAPVFRVSLAGQDCSNITFVESQTTFTCQLGSRSSTREIENLQVAVGDVSDLTWQMANYNMTFEPCNTTACIIGCDGVVGSGLVNDTCGVCGGDNSTCLIGCDGVVGSRLVNDTCGVCGGNNTCLITPVPVTTSGNNGKGGDDDDDHHGAIIGGVIGGFVGLVLIALLVAFLVRRHRQNNQPQPPPEFTVTDVHAGKRFGIEELGTGYAQRGLQTPPIPARPPSGGPANL